MTHEGLSDFPGVSGVLEVDVKNSRRTLCYFLTCGSGNRLGLKVNFFLS